MGTYGTYKVYIIAWKDGSSQIGVKNLGHNWYERFKGDIDSIDQVFGTQIPHRVIADTPEGYRIMTPTEAKKNGFKYRFI
jgi:hypothetical protein